MHRMKVLGTKGRGQMFTLVTALGLAMDLWHLGFAARDSFAWWGKIPPQKSQLKLLDADGFWRMAL